MIAGRLGLANPIVLLITAIAGAAYLIYENWDGITAYFQEKIDRVRAAFEDGLLNGVLKTLAEFNPYVLIMDAAEALFTYITGWSFDDVTERLRAAFDIDLLGAGMALMQSLWDGIKAKFAEVLEWFRTLPDRILEAIGTIDIASRIRMPSLRLWGRDEEEAEAPGRALGGPVRAGQVYRWLEEGQEMFVPRTDGHVVSTREIRDMRRTARGGGGSTVNLGGITINAAPGQDPAAIARAVRRELSKAMGARNIALHDGGAYAV